MPSIRASERQGAARQRPHTAAQASAAPRKHNRDAREQAKTLKTYLATLGIELKHAHALEAVARLHGSASFDALSARLVQAPNDSVPDEAAGKTVQLTAAGLEQIVLETSGVDMPRGFDAHLGPIQVSLLHDVDISTEYFELCVSLRDEKDVESETGICYSVPLDSSDTECVVYVSRVARLVEDLLVASNGALGVKAMFLQGLTEVRECGFDSEAEMQRTVQALDRSMSDGFQLWHLTRVARHHFPSSPHLVEVLYHELEDQLVARARTGVHIVDQEEQDIAEREATARALKVSARGVEAQLQALQETVGRQLLRSTLFENINLPFFR